MSLTMLSQQRSIIQDKDNSKCKDNALPTKIYHSGQGPFISPPNHRNHNAHSSSNRASRPRSLKGYKFPYFKQSAAHKHGRFTRYRSSKEQGLASSDNTKYIKNHKNALSIRPRNHTTHNSKGKASQKPKHKMKHSKQVRRAKKKLQNNVVRQHINYFAVPHEIIPQHLKHLIPFLLETGDYSQAFYYESPDGAKSIIYIHSGDCTDAGRPRFVFIAKYLIASDSLFKIAKLSCNEYFSCCPMAAIDRTCHIIHLFGNNTGDKGKYLSFSLKTNTVLHYGLMHDYDDTIPISQVVHPQYGTEYPKSVANLNRLSALIVLKDTYPQSNYKRYLFVPRLQILLRFGGADGVDNTVQYIDIKDAIWCTQRVCRFGKRCHFGTHCKYSHKDTAQGVKNEKKIRNVEWKTYDFKLDGSALSMHFVIAYDHLLYVFDVKGGGNGKIWIIDLLFGGHKVCRALKSLDTWFAYDFAVKISPNYVKFINATRYGEMLVSLSDIMPLCLLKYYDQKSKALVHGYCRKVSDLLYSFPMCLIGTIFSFYQPFF
eukprot:877178_1